MSQLSANRCFICFLGAMLQHLDCYLSFPTVERVLHRVHEEFCTIVGLLNMIGCVDMMHMPLLNPHNLPML